MPTFSQGHAKCQKLKTRQAAQWFDIFFDGVSSHPIKRVFMKGSRSQTMLTSFWLF